MKYCITGLILILLSTNLLSQKRVYIRIYTMGGKLVEKGYLTGTTDSSILLSKKDVSMEIKITEIGFIKSGRSADQTLLMGGLITGTISGFWKMFAWVEPKSTTSLFSNISIGGLPKDTRFSMFSAGFILGGIGGTAITGIIVGLTKHSLYFPVKNEYDVWQKTKKDLDNMIPGAKNKDAPQ